MNLVKKISVMLIALPQLSACVTIPTDDHLAEYRCEISTSRKVLRVVDVAEDTNTYYSVTGLILSPILVPTSALVSGSYVLVNNIYSLGEEKLACENEAPEEVVS